MAKATGPTGAPLTWCVVRVCRANLPRMLTVMADEHDSDELALFEERAEYLTDSQFDAWTAPAPHEAQVLRQLTSTGPKLLSGPRGCGKTTMMKRAQRNMRAAGRSLPIYVNYGRSMFIEPAFARRADADGFFLDWLVAKVIVGLADELAEQGLTGTRSEYTDTARAFVDAAESDPSIQRIQLPGPNRLAAHLDEVAVQSGFGNTVLLLDDAAHAFVPEQQRIFFDFVRNLKTQRVTYKAAIYPGVTEFSPNFHVGHDAKMVRAWIPVEGREYLNFMRSAFERRLPDAQRSSIPSEVVDFFAGASFGIPRTFFSMLEMYLDQRTESSGKKARLPLQVVETHADQLRVVHRGLKTKLPRYERYVDAGETVLSNGLRAIKELNESRSDGSPVALDLAIKSPASNQLGTVIGLMEYVGLLRSTAENVSIGKSSYSKYAIHGALLVSATALRFGQNPTLADRGRALVRSARNGSFARVVESKLLPPAEAQKCQLQVGRCPQCKAERLHESARFCHHCGSELVEVSRLTELLAASIDELLLTDKKRSALRAVDITTVEAIVRDRGLTQISKASRVGPTWARRIYSVAEEYVGV